tara:strand:- start:418 stop:786 length:369 start_codon:yes stop_codon:yes gene_type:complete
LVLICPRLVFPNLKHLHFVAKNVIVYIPHFPSPTENFCERSPLPEPTPQLPGNQPRERADKFDVGRSVVKSNQDMNVVFLNAPGVNSMIESFCLAIHGLLNEISIFKQGALAGLEHQMNRSF